MSVKLLPDVNVFTYIWDNSEILEKELIFQTPSFIYNNYILTVGAYCLQKWEYMHETKPNSPEEKLVQVLREPRDWLNIELKSKRSAAWKRIETFMGYGVMIYIL